VDSPWCTQAMWVEPHFVVTNRTGVALQLAQMRPVGAVAGADRQAGATSPPPEGSQRSGTLRRSREKFKTFTGSVQVQHGQRIGGKHRWLDVLVHISRPASGRVQGRSRMEQGVERKDRQRVLSSSVQ
jgi:hypothetical protein